MTCSLEGLDELVQRGLMRYMGRAGILSYFDLATRAKLDPRTVRGLGHGATVATLARIAGVLDCGVHQLLDPDGRTE